MSAQFFAGWRYAAVNDAGRVVGEWRWRAKLTDAEVELIRSLREQGLSYAKIAAKFDDDDGVRVSKTHVFDICKYRKRAQTTAGHSRRPLQRGKPADPGEFDR
jgi:hypothetical protein